LVANETIIKALAGAETPASFAVFYASNDPEVSAHQSIFWSSGHTVLAGRINLQTGWLIATLDSRIYWG
jgi:hypothetical protein